MNELLKLLRRRRSVRTYSGEHVTEEQLDQILEAALLSMSGRAAYPCELVAVRDRETLRALTACRTGAAGMLAGADCAVAVIGSEAVADTVVEDASIMMTQMHLMAESLGLGSCWIQIRGRKAADGQSSEDCGRAVLGIPADRRFEAILSIGVPAGHPAGRSVNVREDRRVHREHY